jgi:ABC-type dipeptide/oligopeptide/nickel transport system permease component
MFGIPIGILSAVPVAGTATPVLVVFKHGLRGALTPMVTMLGLDLATVINGLFITEALFGLPGSAS